MCVVNMQSVTAVPTARGESLSANEVKRRIESLGVGVAARVKVRLRDGMKMEGYIDLAGEDHFYLVRTDDKHVGTAAVVAYSDVVKLNGKKINLNWRNVTIRTGLGAAAFIAFVRSLRLAPKIGPQPSRQ